MYRGIKPLNCCFDCKSDLAEEEIEYGPAQKCGNCVAFDISPRMKSCIGEDEEDTKTGYCWMHKINCLKENWCNTWVAGGPIEEDEESYEKQ